MRILKELDFTLEFDYSLKNKETARCPEQFIGHDQNGNCYLVVYANNPTQIFYAKRAVEKQAAIQKELPEGMKCNIPVHCKMHADGYYAVYHYYETAMETNKEYPDKWIRTLYETQSIEYKVTPNLIGKIERDFLSAWPEDFHPLIIQLQDFTKFHNILSNMPNLKICFQHGDFTHNNILKIDNDVYLMDFEFSVDFQPIGFDLFDYHYSLDQKYVDVPYMELNETKEKLINEINSIIDRVHKPHICNQFDLHLPRVSSWADNMIYNRPDLYIKKNTFRLNIKYEKNIYLIHYTINGYKAAMHVWMRSIPVSVLNFVADYILKNHKCVLKIEINCAMSNIKNALSADNNWIIFLPNDPNEIIERLSKKSRYNFKREIRMLIEQCGEISILEYNDSKTIPCWVFETYFEWKKTTHGTEYGISGKDYIDKYHVNGAMILMAGDTTAAILFYCVSEETVYLENISYNIKYSKCSPGIILYENFLEKMTIKGVKSVFLGNGNQTYKTRFDSTEYLVYSGSVYRNKAIEFLNTLKRKFR